MELVNKGKKHIYIQDVSGGIEYSRTILEPAYWKDREFFFKLTGRYSTAPLDNYLGVDKLPFHMTLPMMAHVATTVVNTKSFSEAARILKEAGYKKVSVSLVDQVSEVVGQAIWDYQKICADRVKERISADKKIGTKGADIHKFKSLNPEKILILMMDGHTVYLRKYSTGKHDIDDGGKCGCDCRVGIAFKLSDCIVESDGKGGETVRIKNKDLTALICPKDEFQYYFGDLALRNGADDCELIAVVSDGADYIHNMVETLFGSYVHIRDIWHTKECIGKYFLAIYAHDTQKGHELADKLCTLLEEGKLTKLLKELEPYKDITADEDGSKLVHPYFYIYERCDGMEYDLYKLLGLPIGSGTMESTNKCFHRRMRTTGALWTKLKANRMVMTIATNEAGGENLILSILIRMENVLISIKDNIDKDKISRKYQKPAR